MYVKCIQLVNVYNGHEWFQHYEKYTFPKSKQQWVQDTFKNDESYQMYTYDPRSTVYMRDENTLSVF